MSAVSPDLAEEVDASMRRVGDSRVKRLMDIILSASILLFTLPLMLVIALMILVDSGRPIFFTQRRSGLRGTQFRIFKFRSMNVMEDGVEINQAKQVDARVTKLGAFLRRSSMDELPQLLNVLHGDMSLVGPRPHALAHDEHFAALVSCYGDRFRARPGMTGLAQVSGLRGEIRSVDQIINRVKLDVAYIETWSIGMDVRILLKTLQVIAFNRNAY